MRKLVLLISSVLLFSCGNTPTEEKRAQVTQPENSGRVVYSYGWNTNVRVFEVDSCEYIGFDANSDGGTSIIHKQNCKFCAKRNGK